MPSFQLFEDHFLILLHRVYLIWLTHFIAETKSGVSWELLIWILDIHWSLFFDVCFGWQNPLWHGVGLRVHFMWILSRHYCFSSIRVTFFENGRVLFIYLNQALSTIHLLIKFCASSFTVHDYYKSFFLLLFLLHMVEYITSLWGNNLTVCREWCSVLWAAYFGILYD